MLTEWGIGIPGWLLAGLVLGAILTGLVAAVFAIGTRAFPDAEPGGDGDAGEGKRRSEIRRYLRTIDEPFAEDHVVAGRSVAFFLPDRNVAITFDAQEYFLLERAGIRAILVEHELPGAQIGHRLPFETPEIAPEGRIDGGDGPFAVLGLDPSATLEDVRAAYRERIKQAHPDHGGDPEAFSRVREAYTAAKERAK